MDQTSWRTILLTSVLSATTVFALGYLYIWAVGL